MAAGWESNTQIESKQDQYEPSNNCLSYQHNTCNRGTLQSYKHSLDHSHWIPIIFFMFHHHDDDFL